MALAVGILSALALRSGTVLAGLWRAVWWFEVLAIRTDSSYRVSDTAQGALMIFEGLSTYYGLCSPPKGRLLCSYGGPLEWERTQKDVGVGEGLGNVS